MQFREPLLLVFAAFAGGTALAKLQAFLPHEILWSLASLVFLAVLAYYKRFRAVSVAAILASLLSAGITSVAIRTYSAPPSLSTSDNVPALFEGCVVDPALATADRERFALELAPNARAQVSLYSRDSGFPELSYGRRVELVAKAKQPHNYANPGSFDNVHYLARQHIFWNLSGDASKIRITGGLCDKPLARGIFAIRTAALNRLDSLYSNDAYADGMMQAILIGATARLDRLWTEDYRSTGTFHALVISGSHVAVLAAVLLFLLRICAVPRSVAVFLTIVVAWIYAGVTGWQSPVLRSAAGMTLYGFGQIFFRKARLLNILAAVALAFIVVDPEQLFDASFQLSFLAVAVIGAFVEPFFSATSAPLSNSLADLGDVSRDIHMEPRAAQFRIEMRLAIETLGTLGLPRPVSRIIVSAVARTCFYFWEVFVASFFIQIGLALPMVGYFHRMSFSGLSANAIVVPVLTAIVPLGFLAILLNSATLAHVCAWLLSLARAAASLHARWEPNWRIPAPPFWLGAVFVFLFVVAAWRGSRWVRFFGWAGVAVAFTVIVIHPFAPVLERGKLELSAIDVGQGDSLLVAFPQGELMLIDAGGIPGFGRARRPSIDIGEDVVSPYLWSRSIKRLDIVAMTHAHEDHMGGMVAVLRNFRPRELWTGATQESPEWQTVRAAAASLNIKTREMRRGEEVPFGGVKLRVLAPGPDYLSGDTPKNDDSLVMRLRFGSTSFLLTGDMEKRIERELAGAGLLQHDDVLKVGHHGSRTSTSADLLDAETPAFGVISAGFDNSYGHPHPATLATLEERHVATFRTDRQGLITFLSDGRRITVTRSGPD